METPLSDKHWHTFDEGRTIGSSGEEDGIIITDIEHVHGARIVVEENSPAGPYAISFGIYGLLFHTHFKTHFLQVNDTVQWLRSKIDAIFSMYELPEDQRTGDWYHEHDKLVHELTID